MQRPGPLDTRAASVHIPKTPAHQRGSPNWTSGPAAPAALRWRSANGPWLQDQSVLSTASVKAPPLPSDTRPAGASENRYELPPESGMGGALAVSTPLFQWRGVQGFRQPGGIRNPPSPPRRTTRGDMTPPLAARAGRKPTPSAAVGSAQLDRHRQLAHPH